MDKRFLGILAAIAIIFVGVFLITTHHSNGGSGNSSSGQPSNHVEGQDASGVKLVEYGDYECPVCADYWQTVKQAEEQLNHQILFQFRNLPLSSIHPNAFAAARAAEAAGLQNKYWQMHDQLYANQNTWAPTSNPQSYFDSYAKTIGLNVAQFDSDYASGKVNDTINADINEFDKTGQQMATPTFFLDGKYINNTQLIDSQTGQPSVQLFVNLINAEIKAKAKS